MGLPNKLLHIYTLYNTRILNKNHLCSLRSSSISDNFVASCLCSVRKALKVLWISSSSVGFLTFTNFSISQFLFCNLYHVIDVNKATVHDGLLEKHTVCLFAVRPSWTRKYSSYTKSLSINFAGYIVTILFLPYPIIQEVSVTMKNTDKVLQ